LGLKLRLQSRFPARVLTLTLTLPGGELFSSLNDFVGHQKGTVEMGGKEPRCGEGGRLAVVELIAARAVALARTHRSASESGHHQEYLPPPLYAQKLSIHLKVRWNSAEICALMLSDSGGEALPSCHSLACSCPVGRNGGGPMLGGAAVSSQHLAERGVTWP